MGNFRAIFVRVLAVFAAGAFTAPLPAQSFPVKPIRIISPGIAGSPGDVRARQVAQKLTETLGQPVVVDNRPGANGAIAAALAAKAPPDGYTLLSCNGNHVLNELLTADQAVRLNRDFVPITRLTAGPLILAVHPSVPAASLKGFIDLAKAKPGALTYASAGPGSLQQLLGELIESRTGIRIVAVAYKSTSAEIPDLLGGYINATFNYFQIIGPHFASGKLRALAVANAKRLAVAPDIVTMSDAGLAGVEATGWNGICVPVGAAQPVIDLLYRQLVVALNDPVIRNQMISTGADVGGETPAEFAAFIHAERAKWGEVIKQAGITLQ